MWWNLRIWSSTKFTVNLWPPEKRLYFLVPCDNNEIDVSSEQILEKLYFLFPSPKDDTIIFLQFLISTIARPPHSSVSLSSWLRCTASQSQTVSKSISRRPGVLNTAAQLWTKYRKIREFMTKRLYLSRINEVQRR